MAGIGLVYFYSECLGPMRFQTVGAERVRLSRPSCESEHLSPYIPGMRSEEQIQKLRVKEQKRVQQYLDLGVPVDACAKSNEGDVAGIGAVWREDRLGLLPLTWSLAVYLTSAAGLLATQVKSPEWRESRLEMLRRLE